MLPPPPQGANDASAIEKPAAPPKPPPPDPSMQVGGWREDDELFQYVAECFVLQFNETQIRDALIAHGYAADVADRIIREVWDWLRQKVPAIAARERRWQRFDLIVGAICWLFALGVVAGFFLGHISDAKWYVFVVMGFLQGARSFYHAIFKPHS